MPCWFSRSSNKFQGHKRQKIDDFYPNWAFLDVTPVWINWWLRKGAQRLTKHRIAWCGIEEVSYCFFSRSSMKFRDHTDQNINDSNTVSVSLLQVTVVEYLRLALFVRIIHYFIENWSNQDDPFTKQVFHFVVIFFRGCLCQVVAPSNTVSFIYIYIFRESWVL